MTKLGEVTWVEESLTAEEEEEDRECKESGVVRCGKVLDRVHRRGHDRSKVRALEPVTLTWREGRARISQHREVADHRRRPSQEEADEGQQQRRVSRSVRTRGTRRKSVAERDSEIVKSSAKFSRSSACSRGCRSPPGHIASSQK